MGYLRQKAHLEDWWVEKFPVTFDGSYRLGGKVYNHPNPKNTDGMLVFTSLLFKIDFAERAAKTVNTYYTLGAALNSGEPSKIPGEKNGS